MSTGSKRDIFFWDAEVHTRDRVEEIPPEVNSLKVLSIVSENPKRLNIQTPRDVAREI